MLKFCFPVENGVVRFSLEGHDALLEVREEAEARVLSGEIAKAALEELFCPANVQGKLRFRTVAQSDLTHVEASVTVTREAAAGLFSFALRHGLTDYDDAKALAGEFVTIRMSYGKMSFSSCAEVSECNDAEFNALLRILQVLGPLPEGLEISSVSPAFEWELIEAQMLEIPDFEPPEEMKELIPQGWLARYSPRRVAQGITDLDIVVHAFAERKHVLLEGPTGCGKNHLLLAAAEKLGLPCVSISLNGMSTPEDLIGRWVLRDGGTQFMESPFVKIFRYGGVVVLDEINAAPPEVLFVLHQALDDRRLMVLVEKDGEVVKASEHFIVAATMNPGYIGTIELNKALRDRFAVKLLCLPNTDFEFRVLADALGSERAEQVMEAIRRSRNESNGISTRTVIYLAELLQKYPPTLAAMLAGLTPEQAELLKSCLA